MLHLKPYSSANPATLNALKHNPALSDLLSDAQQSNPEQVATLIGPILQAPERCSITPLYIQAIATEQKAVLVTNLSATQELEVTGQASSWLIGRSVSCAITVQERSVSRCHAVVGCYPSLDFYIADVGSSNGTRVNRRRLAPLERHLLKDGDLIELGSLCIEFFVVTDKQAAPTGSDATATHY